MHKRLQHLLGSFAASAIFILALLGLSTASVAAQSSASSIAVSPPSYELSANPGDQLTNSIRVDNTQHQNLDVTAEVRNFTALGEEGEINLSPDANAYALSQWITVTPAKATIAPGGSQVFNFAIKVPSNAEPGGRFGSIVFKTSAKPLTGQSGVSVGQEVGSLIFLKIAGNATEKSSIVGFSTATKVNQYKPVDFIVRVKNEGNVHIKPTGTITITNFYGKTVASLPLDSHNVLPGAIRRMDAEWKGGGRFIFGKYTATASLTYGSNKKIITASTSFWGLPYTIILVGLGVLILLGLAIYRGRKRLKLALRALLGKA